MMPDHSNPDVAPAADADSTVEWRLRADALERQLAAIEQETHSRLIRAELKAEAIRAGMVDLDGLKLLDTGSVKLTATGEVEGAGALMAEFKRAKPWLFGSPSSSSPLRAPPVQPPVPKKATDMTEEEWRAARAALLKRRV